MSTLFTVTYCPRNSNEIRVATVRVGDNGDGTFYASDMGHGTDGPGWGCGKDATTETMAVYNLVQDMATVQTITPVA